MRASDLRSKTTAELNELLLGFYKEQFNLKMQKATGQLAKSDRIRKIRHDVARIKTIFGESGRQE